ncbi:MAG: phosphoglycerate kinase [Patescibacteria group bacterium]|jgi:phosphoglycerate kinase
MKLKTIKEIKNLKGKRVLVRVDFNCPIKNGRVIDDTRIQAALETIKYLIQQKAIVILISHLGDPFKNPKSEIRNPKQIQNSTPTPTGRGSDRSVGEFKNKYSLKPVAKYINRLHVPGSMFHVKFIDDCVGEKVRKETATMKPGEIILLENLRFYDGEEKNDLKFAKQLAGLADLYINDAFSVCHRAHASVSAITHYLPAYAGFCLIKEIENLSQVLTKPLHPFIVLMGGVKISTKIKTIENLAKKGDQILIGGALANTFLKIKGVNIGASFYEPTMIKMAKKLAKNKKIILPLDVETEGRDNDFKILDIGPKTVELFQKYLKTAKTIIWNGPMGLFEEKPFDQGTKEMIKIILNNRKAKIIIGGGETIASLQEAISNFQFLISKPNIFISTGGGAMLEFLEGKILPGIKPLIKF